MTKSRLLTAVAGSLLLVGLCVWTVLAQGPARPTVSTQATGQQIAVLDVSRIFKDYVRFQQKMAGMRASLERAEATVKQERDTIQNMANQLNEVKSGTQAYKDLEAQATQRTADLQVQMKLQQKEFLQQESTIYYETYQELQQHVNYFAAQNGIAAVIRFSGDPVSKDEPDSVLRDINKNLVWHSPGLDITEMILSQLNARSQPIDPRVSERPRGPGNYSLPNPN